MAIKKYGIDISSWQGNIDLKPYKGQFVIIRAGYDVTEDNKAKRNMDECERLGIPYGVYWYSYALTPTQAKAEAQACLKVIKGRDIKVGVWFDMEDADNWKRNHGFSFTRSNISAVCNAFCDVIALKGYYTGIYTSRSWFDNWVDCPKYDRWVAQWGSNNGKVNADTSAMGSLLQYTSKPIDKDLSYVDLSHFKTPSNTVNPQKKKLDVDGIMGYLTVSAWQTWIGTYVDGEISGQLKALSKCYPSLTAVAFGGGGSPCIAQTQKYLIKEGYSVGKSGADGILGPETVKAVQKMLKAKWYNIGSWGADGIWGTDTAKAWQKFLNDRM